MSIRTWRPAPSAEIEVQSGRYPVVTQEDLVKAVLDGAIMVDRAGGVLMVAVTRIPTGVPNEYVTTGALVTWQDRTNAKPQAEPSAVAETPLLGDVPSAVAIEHAVLDDGLRVDPDAVDVSDPELQAALGG